MKTSLGWPSATFQHAGASQRGYQLAANKSSGDDAEICVLHIVYEKTGISAVELLLKHGKSSYSKHKEGRTSLRISVRKLAKLRKFAKRVHYHVGPSYDGTIVNVLLSGRLSDTDLRHRKIELLVMGRRWEEDLLKDHTGADTLKGEPQYNPFAGDIRRA